MELNPQAQAPFYQGAKRLLFERYDNQHNVMTTNTSPFARPVWYTDV